MNTDSGTTRREARIAELDHIIQTEEAKPDPDYQLIDDCIREIGELEGAKVEFSKEEVAEATKKILRKAEREKRRKRIVRYAAAAAAVVVLVGGVTACTVNPAVVDWFARIVRMPWHSSLDVSELTYEKENLRDVFTSLEELVRREGVPIYYPINIEEYTDLMKIIKINSSNSIIYIFNYENADISLSIENNCDMSNHYTDYEDIINTEYGDFIITNKEDRSQAEGIIENHLYIISADTHERIVTIIKEWERIE